MSLASRQALLPCLSSACLSRYQAPWYRPPSLSISSLPQTREKERMKEAKDARYTNGHLFTTISVSGMTMCYACNKSITAKEALICPSKLFGPSLRLGACPL